MTEILTLSERNQFSFTCPLFNAEVKMAGCMMLRDLKWAGKQHHKRLGCQAAMECNKCPAAVIVSQTIFAKREIPDDHGSLTPVSGKLRADVLERVLPVMMQEKVMDRIGVPDVERQLLRTANARIEAQLGHAPSGKSKIVDRSAGQANGESRVSRRTTPKLPPVPANDALSTAAQTGDLAAAING